MCLLYCACHASFQILFKCSTQGAQSPAKRHLNVQKCSGPYPSVFCTFDFEMWFAPQRRAFFQHLNFQKCSERGVLCTFWLGNMLRATTACTFSTSQLPKMLWTCQFFNTFDFEMCFAPQLFPHLNFKKWSEHGLFCTFWPHQPL